MSSDLAKFGMTSFEFFKKNNDFKVFGYGAIILMALEMEEYYTSFYG